jgi:hypothetical protein
MLREVSADVRSMTARTNGHLRTIAEIAKEETYASSLDTFSATRVRAMTGNSDRNDLKRSLGSSMRAQAVTIQSFPRLFGGISEIE